MAKYLIVDNAVAVRFALRRDLAAIDHRAEFMEAETGEEALRMAADWRPDAIVMGLGLANGERAIPTLDQMLRDEPARPVVVCTSMPRDHPEVGEAMSLGAFAYVPKPVRREALRGVLVQIETNLGRMKRVR